MCLNHMSIALHLISKNVDAFVFNSSQWIEDYPISDWNKSNKPKYFDIYEHNNTKVRDIHIGYS